MKAVNGVEHDPVEPKPVPVRVVAVYPSHVGERGLSLWTSAGTEVDASELSLSPYE